MPSENRATNIRLNVLHEGPLGESDMEDGASQPRPGIGLLNSVIRCFEMVNDPGALVVLSQCRKKMTIDPECRQPMPAETGTQPKQEEVLR